jgi:YVTN family beta-propeller protein
MPGKVASGVVVHPDGKRVFVSDGKAGALYAVDPATNAVVATVEVGARPWNMALTPDGKKLYVANGRSNSVSVIEVASFRKVADIAVGELPWGVAIR